MRGMRGSRQGKCIQQTRARSFKLERAATIVIGGTQGGREGQREVIESTGKGD